MNRSVLFRELDDTEVQEFQEWARANHKPGDPIEREIWHPVLVAECELIDSGTFTIWFQDGGGRQEFLSALGVKNGTNNQKRLHRFCMVPASD